MFLSEPWYFNHAPTWPPTLISPHAIPHIATSRKVPCCSANGAADQVTAIRLGLLCLKYLASSFDLLRASQQVMLFRHPVHNWKPGLAVQEPDALATISGWLPSFPRTFSGLAMLVPSMCLAG